MRDDLVEQLRYQVDFLARSSEAFDNGYEHEAMRLAVVLRVLLHDTSKSQSLLGQLGEKNKLAFVDTGVPVHQGSFGSSIGLARLYLVTKEYKAPLGDLLPETKANPPQPFGVWWTKPVTKDANGSLFSRKNYVLALANQEGGAHVDPTLEKTWADLTRDNSLGWLEVVGQDQVPLGTPAFATVRQIAYEVTETVAEQLRHLLAP